ncbi:MAG: fatty acid desaturase family protein [Caulobacteraceae bacterium]
MAVATRLNPKHFFSPQEWALLSRRSSWIGIALVVHCYAVIGLAAAMAMVWPITIPLAVMIIGCRQLGLGILGHDAAHGALHPNLKINDWVAKTFTGGGLDAYRAYHLQHHKFAQQVEDPDLVLSAPFPITRKSLRRKMIRDLTGQTYFKARLASAQRALKARKPGGSYWPVVTAFWKQNWKLIAGGAFFTAVGAPFGYWWAWLALWLLPRATWNALVTRLRNIAEHALVPVNEADPMRQARTTMASFLERAFIAPYWVNYHCEHHMFMHVPCYNLPLAHRLLEEKGVTGRMLISPGYWDVISQASGKREKVLAAA